MKLRANQVDAFLRRPKPDLLAVLLFGPDQGLVGERARALVRTVVDDPADPFRVAEFEPDRLKSDPSLLVDEARALSLMGGRRVIRVRPGADMVTPACRLLLALEAAEALVVIEAGELTPRSTLRQLFEGAERGAACPCYREEGSGLAVSLRGLLAEEGLRPDEAALDFLARHLGADRGVTRREIEKLALFMGAVPGGAPVPLRLADVAEAVGDSAALGLADLNEAVGLGERHRLDHVLDRLFAEAVQPVTVLRTLANHIGRLRTLAIAIADGENPQAALGRLKPPVPYPAREAMVRQVRRWRPPALARAASILLEAEIAAKSTDRPARAIARRAAFDLCELARPQTRA